MTPADWFDRERPDPWSATTAHDDRREQLSAARRRVVHQAGAVRRRTMLSIAGITLVMVVGGVLFGMLVRGEQTVSRLSVESEQYERAIQEISRRTTLLLDPKYRESAPPAMVYALDDEVDELLNTSENVRQQVETTLRDARSFPTRYFTFVDPSALNEFENRTVDEEQLAVVERVAIHLAESPNAPLTGDEIRLRAALLGNDFAGPAMEAGDLARELVSSSRADFRSAMLVVGVGTMSAVALLWITAIWPAIRSSRVLVEALDSHASEIEHSYAQASNAQRIAGLGYWYTTDHSGTIKCSPELTQMLTGGTDRPPTTLQALAALTSVGNAEEVQALYERLSVSPGEAEMTHTLSSAGRGDVTIRERVQSFQTGDSLGVSGVMLDISDITAAQHVVNRMEKFEIIDLMISGIAHDFNNLLGVIMGNVELAQDVAQPPIDQYLASVMEATDSAAQLIVRLRQTAMDPLAVAEEFNVVEAVRKAVGSVSVPGNITVELSFDERAHRATVIANRGVFETSVVNLLKNSFEAIERPDGHVIVSVKLDAPLRSTLDSGAEPSSEAPTPWYQGRRSVRVSVADDGPGMGPRVRRRAFQPFFTTKGLNRGNHAGLGLWSVYSFAKAWDGTAEIDSDDGSGSSVTIVLPVTTVNDCPDSGSPGLQPFSIDGRVLLVEDVKELLYLNEQLLRDWGLDVVAVAGFEAACEILNESDDIRLLVSDVHLGPGATGFDLAVLAVTHDPPVGAVLVSGAFRAEDMPEALLVPHCVFLPKPFSHTRLHEAISKTLHEAGYIPTRL